MASAIQAITSQAATSGQTETTPPKASGIDSLANENTFLQLLVQQLKNQDPLSPADGSQFVAQLAQFSQLEQVMQIRSDLADIRATVDKSQATAGDPAQSTSN